MVAVDPGSLCPTPTVLDQTPGYLVPVGAHAFSAIAWGATLVECHRSLRALCEAGRVSAWLGTDGGRTLLAA